MNIENSFGKIQSMEPKEPIAPTKDFDSQKFSQTLRKLISEDPRAVVLNSLGIGDTIIGFKDSEEKMDLIDYTATNIVGDAWKLHEKSGKTARAVVLIEAVARSGKTSIAGPLIRNTEKALSQHHVKARTERMEFGHSRPVLGQYGIYDTTDPMVKRYGYVSKVIGGTIDDFVLGDLGPQGEEPDISIYFLELSATMANYDISGNYSEARDFQLPMGSDIIPQLVKFAAQYPDDLLLRAIGFAPSRKVIEFNKAIGDVREWWVQNLKKSGLIDKPNFTSLRGAMTNCANPKNADIYHSCVWPNILHFIYNLLDNPNVSTRKLQRMHQRAIATYIKNSLILAGVGDIFIGLNDDVITGLDIFVDENARPEELPPLERIVQDLIAKGEFNN